MNINILIKLSIFDITNKKKARLSLHFYSSFVSDWIYSFKGSSAWLPCSLIILTIALPTMTPSAYCLNSFTCSGLLIPKPIATGVFVTWRICSIISSRLLENQDR